MSHVTMMIVKITTFGIPAVKILMPFRIANTLLVVNLKNLCQPAKMNVVSAKHTVHRLTHVFALPSPIVPLLFSNSQVPGFFLTSSKLLLIVTL
jgi:hypothetical protein